ncbi:MAG: hypothetical protein RIQ81_2365 [Pseudomonadota bacterium]
MTFAGFIILAASVQAAPDDNPGAGRQVPPPFPEIPSLTVEGLFLGEAEMMSVGTQEEMFIRRELLEHYFGESQTVAKNRVNRNTQVEMLNRLGSGKAISEIELRKALWERDIAQLDGAISGLQAESLLVYEEMGLIRLRVMAGERVAADTYFRLQIKARETAVKLAEKRVDRAKVELHYRTFRWEAVRHLTEQRFASREEYLDELIDFVAAEQGLATETRRVELAKSALEIVRRQTRSASGVAH